MTNFTNHHLAKLSSWVFVLMVLASIISFKSESEVIDTLCDEVEDICEIENNVVLATVAPDLVAPPSVSDQLLARGLVH